MYRQVLIAASIAFFSATPLSFGGAADSLDGWELLSDDDGIFVYKQIVSDSDVIAIRATARIAASVEAIAAIMKDNSTAAEWMPMIAARRDLKQINDHARIEYTHLAMPWPVTDRYYINLAQADALPGGALRLFVKSVDTPDPQYLESDKVLGFLHVSEFILTPVGEGMTELKLEVKTDPRGLIPKLLVNASQRRWPRDFIEGLEEQVKKRVEQSEKHPLLAR